MNRSEAIELLEVDAMAKPADIERAYRHKARKAHPDVGGSAEEFARLAMARELLLAPEAGRGNVYVIRRRSLIRRVFNVIVRRNKRPSRVQ